MPYGDVPLNFGWVHNPEEVGKVLVTMARPLFQGAAPNLTGTGAGKTVLLYKAWKDVNAGAYIPYPAQTIGDCVSHGFGHGVDLLEAIQISLGHKNEIFKQTATEAVYGMAKEVGNDLSWSDGAVGAWAGKAVTTIGTVNREVVGEYDGQRAKQWGYKGVPADIKAKAKDHKVGAFALVSTYAELEDAISNAFPVPICSNQGFTMVRDANGFCRPKGTWGHCMLVCAIRNDEHPGACIFQSWGPETPSGPLSLDQPPNSFWADPDTVSRMLRMQDTWALSQFDGYPNQKLPEHWSPESWAL